MPGFLFRARLVEPLAREERRHRRIVARAAGRGLRNRRGCRRHGDAAAAGDGRRALELLIQRLEHAGGFLAARHAQIQPLFLALRRSRRNNSCNRSRTGRNPAAPSPPSCASAAACRPRASCARPSASVWSCQGAPPSSSSALFGAGAPDISAAACSPESGVTPEPSSETSPAKKPLSQARCSSENGAVSGTSDGQRRRQVLRHSAASASNIALSASTSCRREKARKVSSREARCAR